MAYATFTTQTGLQARKQITTQKAAKAVVINNYDIKTKPQVFKP